MAHANQSFHPILDLRATTGNYYDGDTTVKAERVAILRREGNLKHTGGT